MLSLPTEEFLKEKYPTRGSFEVQGKTVPIPSIYKGEGVTAVFPISYEKALKAIHSKELKPAKLTLTKALLSITAFVFHESPVGPYTELVYAIPVLYKPSINLPLVSLLLQTRLKNFGFFVLDIMQNTSIAVEHGNRLTGYPHNNKLIDVKFNHGADGFSVEVTGKSGSVLSLLATKPTKGKDVFNSYATYFGKIKDTFKIQMDIYGFEEKVSRCRLNLENHELTWMIQQLGLSSKSLQTRYYPNVTEVNPVTIEHL